MTDPFSDIVVQSLKEGECGASGDMKEAAVTRARPAGSEREKPHLLP